MILSGEPTLQPRSGRRRRFRWWWPLRLHRAWHASAEDRRHHASAEAIVADCHCGGPGAPAVCFKSASHAIQGALSAVERVVQVGKARAISVAGDLKAGMTALDESLPYRFVQIANTPLEPNIDKLKERSRAQNVCDAWDILWPRSNRRDVKYVKGNTGRSWRPAAAVRLKLPAHF